MPRRDIRDVTDEEGDAVMGDPEVPTTTVASTAATSTGKSSSSLGRSGRHGETGLSNIPYSVRTPFAKTAQAVLRYRYAADFTIDPDNASGKASVAKYEFRLNSIYDCRIDAPAYTADPGATAEAADGAGSIDVPTWRKYWSQIYSYWSVVKSKYRIRVVNHITQTNITDRLNISMHLYEHGLQRPPYAISDDSGRLSDWYRRDHDNHDHVVCYANPKNTTKHPHQCFYAGNFWPGKIEHEVVEDELQQTWHKMTEVPPTAENLTIILQKHDDNNSNDNITGRIVVEIDYECQFKDRKAAYTFMDPQYDFAAIDNFKDAGSI